MIGKEMFFFILLEAILFVIICISFTEPDNIWPLQKQLVVGKKRYRPMMSKGYNHTNSLNYCFNLQVYWYKYKPWPCFLFKFNKPAWIWTWMLIKVYFFNKQYMNLNKTCKYWFNKKNMLFARNIFDD